jgi:hypothetical protein
MHNTPLLASCDSQKLCAPLQIVSLEEALDQLAGSRAALEAGGRLLHLQRSFSRGLSAEAMERVLVALKHAMEVEVVYFPNIPMVPAALHMSCSIECVCLIA